MGENEAKRPDNPTLYRCDLTAAYEIAERFGLQRKVPWIAFVIARCREEEIQAVREEKDG